MTDESTTAESPAIAVPEVETMPTTAAVVAPKQRPTAQSSTKRPARTSPRAASVPWTGPFGQSIKRWRHPFFYGNTEDDFHKGGQFFVRFDEAVASVLDSMKYYKWVVDPIAESVRFNDGPSARKRLISRLTDKLEVDESVIDTVESMADLPSALRLLETYLDHHQGAVIVRDANALSSNVLKSRARLVEGIVRLMNRTHLGGMASPVVLIGRSKAIPAELREHPFLEEILVDRPSTDQIFSMFFECIDLFHEGDSLSDEITQVVSEQLTSEMKGSTVRECRALYKFSRNEKIAVADVSGLLTQFRGERGKSVWSTMDRDRVKLAVEELSGRVAGQPVAIEAVASGLRAAVANISFDEPTAATQRPRATYLFAGTSGVGKTETAKALAKFVFGREDSLIRFDMSEFRSEAAYTRLIGSSPGYVGFEKGGELTDAVLNQPQSVVLFDEMEKAQSSILDLFLSIIDDGRCTDGKGTTVDFSETILIFTTNLGINRIETDLWRMSYSDLREVIERTVEDEFGSRMNRPELFGRLRSGLVVFDILRDEAIAPMCEILLRRLSHSFFLSKGATLSYDLDEFALGVSLRLDSNARRYGGRAVRSLLESTVRDRLVEVANEVSIPAGSNVHLSWGPAGILIGF